jgi:F0F1-type ATP synthase assembly protein I
MHHISSKQVQENNNNEDNSNENNKGSVGTMREEKEPLSALLYKSVCGWLLDCGTQDGIWILFLGAYLEFGLLCQYYVLYHVLGRIVD